MGVLNDSFVGIDETAPYKSVRAQAIKLADKKSNLRAILLSPPADWDFQRKKEYFDRAKRIVGGLTANLVLKDECKKKLRTFDEIVRPAGSE